MISKEITTCGIFLFNNEGKFLIGHPTDSEKIKHDFYSIPKGWNEEGESFFESAKRELLEETNIDLDNINVLDKIDIEPHTYVGFNPFVNGMSDKKIISYVIKTDHDFTNDDVRCDSMVTHLGDPFPEIDEFRWVTIDEAYHILHHSQKDLLEEVKLKYNNGNN